MALKSAGCVFCLLVVCGYSQRGDEPAMIHTPLFNYGTEHGDTEIKDYSGSNEIELPFNISFFGSSYKYLYISPDGTVGFVKAIRYEKKITWEEGVRNSRNDLPFLAPFYYDGFRPLDLDPTRYQGHIYHRTIYRDKLDSDEPHYSDDKQTIDYFGQYLKDAVVNPPEDFDAEMAVIITWDNVPSESQSDGDCTSDNPCKAATFQALLVADTENTFAIFNYLRMDVPIHETYQAGFNGGYQRGWSNVIPCHGRCSVNSSLSVSRINELPDLKGSDLKGRYILNVGHEVIVRGGCLPGHLRAGKLEVYPRQVGMFGGELLQVSGSCQDPTQKIYCRFGTSNNFVTNGAMSNGMKGYCPVPKLTVKGELRLFWSTDGQVWISDRTISVVLPSMAETTIALQPSIVEKWLSRDAKTITIPWDRNSLSESESARVEIRLIGYREIGNQVEYKSLQNFGEASNSQGRIDVVVESHRCKENCDDFEMGLIEVALPSEYHGVSVKRVAVRYGPIPLGWWVNEELTERRDSDWSDQKCYKWHADDSKHEQWIKHLLPCPCSLDQALADFGRWQADPGCNLFAGSKCHYHKNAKHCVRSVVPTEEGAGNQCCYNNDGTLRYSQLSYQGSTPDRSHVWGAYPYGKPDHVPSLSHWKHDVISFYYCCLWNGYDLCDLYMEQRPTADCPYYDAPGIAFLRGDPHITTFDGQLYQFGGVGDFWLVKAQEEGVQIQGRFQPRDSSWDLGVLSKSSSWKPSALTALAIQGLGQTIEIHPAPENAINPRGLDVRIGEERKFFLHKSTMRQDFRGQTIVNNARTAENNAHNNFTILMKNNVGVNVVGVNGLLHVTVVLPPSMKPSQEEKEKHKGLGLMGNYDENKDNDFTPPSGAVISPDRGKRDLFEYFALPWQVKTEESLFTFPQKASDLDKDHAYFEYSEIPSEFKEAPQSGMISSFCQGDEVCKWDYKITGDRNIAQATKKANENFAFIKSAAYRVDNCGLPKIGKMATLSNYNFSVGQEIRVTGCDNDQNFGGEATFRCIKERADEAKEHDRDYYGIKRFDKKDKVEYIVHWIPEPFTVCSDDESADIGLIIGIVAGCIGFIFLVLVIVFFIYKKRKSGKSEYRSKPTPANRVTKETERDPASAEAMLTRVEERSPVYKPSREPVRMSEIKGSNV